MTYRVELRPAAVRALKQIDHQDRNRIRGAIALLGRTHFPDTSEVLLTVG